MISAERKPNLHEAGGKATLGPPATAVELRQDHFAAVYAYVSRRIQPREDAEDVTQETFIAALREFGRVKGDPRLWLYGIARRKLADLHRKRSRKASTTPAPTPSAQSLAEARQVTEVLRTLVERLPTDQREAILLQHLEELSLAEIATVMGRSHKSVKGLLARAKETLRESGRSYFTDEED
jgi:RNA polymerase sigma-70 factor (ECF subfamily)